MLDVVIIGAGIAGCTAAVYAARNRMDYLLVSDNFGGQFLESGMILNYPGVIQTDGFKFRSAFEKQLEFNGVQRLIGPHIKKIESIENGFRLIGDRQEFETQTVIIATGSHPRKLNVPGEDSFLNRGVTYCSVCDGPLFADKIIAIIGGGNSALEGIHFTHRIAKKIYLINIEDHFSAHAYLSETIASFENVEVIDKARTFEIFGDDFVQGLRYEREGKQYQLDVHGIIIEIGRTPNTDFLKGFVELDEKKHVVIDCQSRTSVEGVFAAGDCASGLEYQYVIAAGQGCIALLKAARYLSNRRDF
ncbi:MAG: FAD-dependent oxidoreductase [Candidatus Omnitrophota bacterium]